jgi:SAM-dependent methyltransferase
MSVKRCGYRFVAVLLVGLSLLMGSAFAQAQNGKDVEEPQPGQGGKDVIWLPSEQGLVDRMLNLAKVTSADYVIDLGSGDGRIVITAARLGARARGIEYNDKLVEVSRRNASRAGVTDRAQFVQGDIFESDFSQATVLTMFLLPDLNMKLRPTILGMKPGTRIVSNSFDMEDWTPDQTVTVTSKEGCSGSYCMTFLWIVPAKVEGLWKLPQADLLLKQNFQMLTGEFKRGNTVIPIIDGRMDGNRIHFRVGDTLYDGQLVGNILQGTFADRQNGTTWEARRADR